MRTSVRAAVTAAGVICGMTAFASGTASASVTGGAAVVGHIELRVTRTAVVRNLPTRPAPDIQVPRVPLGRDGRPAGSGLRSAPSAAGKGAPAPAPAPASVAATAFHAAVKFNGIAEAAACGSCQPSDVSAATDGTSVLELANGAFSVYSTGGTLQHTVPLATFLDTSDGVTEPRVLYDPTWKRWSIVMTDTTTPSLWLLYSQSADPLGAWWFYQIAMPYAAGSIIDDPMVGMDEDAFIYTSNNYDPSGTYINSTSFVVPKARVYNGFEWSAGLPGVAFGTAPVTVAGVPTAQSAKTYMIAADDASNVIYLYAWTQTSQAPSLKFVGSLAYNWAAPPRRVNQPGTAQTLNPGDGRFASDPVQLGPRVWFTHGVAIGSFPGVDYGFVNVGTKTVHFNTAFHSSTSDDLNPSIGAATDPISGGTDVTLNWAYTDVPNNVPATDAAAGFRTGGTLPHKTGVNYLPASFAHSTTETEFGAYSSVAPMPVQNGSCAVGQQSLVANQFFNASGQWVTRLALVGAC